MKIVLGTEGVVVYGYGIRKTGCCKDGMVNSVKKTECCCKDCMRIVLGTEGIVVNTEWKMVLGKQGVIVNEYGIRKTGCCCKNGMLNSVRKIGCFCKD
jgi:hypothetical protein